MEDARAKENLQRYFVGMAALLAYDYCLTIGQELEEIWTGNRSLSAFFDQPFATVLALITRNSLLFVCCGAYHVFETQMPGPLKNSP